MYSSSIIPFYFKNTFLNLKHFNFQACVLLKYEYAQFWAGFFVLHFAHIMKYCTVSRLIFHECIVSYKLFSANSNNFTFARKISQFRHFFHFFKANFSFLWSRRSWVRIPSPTPQNITQKRYNTVPEPEFVLCLFCVTLTKS